MNEILNIDHSRLVKDVYQSLQDDLGSGDITSDLVSVDATMMARLITREPGIVCGIPWFNEVFNQVDSQVSLKWCVVEGERVTSNQVLVEVAGLARSILSAEREALNWLQTLSGVATRSSQYVDKVRGFSVHVLDTRKTLPGMRYPQKYATSIGGVKNHRMGLYDAFLIKENHIASCGSIENAIAQAKYLYPGKTVEVEVENEYQLVEALNNGADIIMLDNFTLEGMRHAVNRVNKKALLEVSGNVSLETIKDIAQTGVDFISVGSITKHVTAMDLSLRFVSEDT